MRTSTFQDQFFSQTMSQSFNRVVSSFRSDEAEPAVRKYLRAHNQL